MASSDRRGSRPILQILCLHGVLSECSMVQHHLDDIKRIVSSNSTRHHNSYPTDTDTFSSIRFEKCTLYL